MRRGAGGRCAVKRAPRPCPLSPPPLVGEGLKIPAPRSWRYQCKAAILVHRRRACIGKHCVANRTCTRCRRSCRRLRKRVARRCAKICPSRERFPAFRNASDRGSLVVDEDPNARRAPGPTGALQPAVVAQRCCRGAHEGSKACSAISARYPFTGQQPVGRPLFSPLFFSLRGGASWISASRSWA